MRWLAESVRDDIRRKVFLGAPGPHTAGVLLGEGHAREQRNNDGLAAKPASRNAMLLMSCLPVSL